jgi:hypothetical protein
MRGLRDVMSGLFVLTGIWGDEGIMGWDGWVGLGKKKAPMRGIEAYCGELSFPGNLLCASCGKLGVSRYRTKYPIAA